MPVAWILFYVVIYLRVSPGPCGLHLPDHDNVLLTDSGLYGLHPR